MASTSFLQQAYLAYFGRPADAAGLLTFANASEASVIASFSASAESQQFFGSMDTFKQINTIYKNLFNREAEPAGLNHWAGKIISGEVTLAAAAMQESDLSTFNQLVQQAGLKDALQGSTPVTVFAPSNEAFKALPAATLEALSKNPDELRMVLKHHVVPGRHPQASVSGAVMMSTIADTKLPVSKAGDFLTVESGLVIKGDIQTSNGVLHIIDAVALPPKPKKK